MDTTKLEINTPTYHSSFQRLSQDLIALNRKHFYSPDFNAIDTYGNYNLYAYAILRPGELEITVNSQSFEIAGEVSIFIPKFSIVNWKINSSNLQWKAFVSDKDFDTSLKTVSIYKSFISAPQSISEISDWLSNASLIHQFTPDASPNKTPSEVKKFIDKNYRDELEIADIAKNFSLSSSQLTKIFKNHFHLSPVEYRSKLRIFQSMFNLLTQDQTVIDIASHSGFNDLSRFNKQFKKITNATPSKFKF